MLSLTVVDSTERHRIELGCEKNYHGLDDICHKFRALINTQKQDPSMSELNTASKRHCNVESKLLAILPPGKSPKHLEFPATIQI